MYGLEMPQPSAGGRVQSHQGIAEEPRTLAITAIKIGSRRSERQKDDSAFGIDAQGSPGVQAAAVLPSVLWPRLIARFVRARHGVEGPHEFPRTGVECAHVSRRTAGFSVRHE